MFSSVNISYTHWLSSSLDIYVEKSSPPGNAFSIFIFAIF